MSAVKRSAAHKYEDGAVYWDKDSTGVVEEVHDTGDGVYISVRSDEKMRVGDKMCLTADHEVLTDKGWKIISEVKVNDKTASLNPQGLVEYTSVESTHHYDDSELFQAGMLMTSPEHMLAGIENRGENGTEKTHQNEDRHDGSCAHARKLENNEPESANKKDRRKYRHDGKGLTEKGPKKEEVENQAEMGLSGALSAQNAPVDRSKVSTPQSGEEKIVEKIFADSVKNRMDTDGPPTEFVDCRLYWGGIEKYEQACIECTSSDPGYAGARGTPKEPMSLLGLGSSGLTKLFLSHASRTEEKIRMLRVARGVVQGAHTGMIPHFSRLLSLSREDTVRVLCHWISGPRKVQIIADSRFIEVPDSPLWDRIGWITEPSRYVDCVRINMDAHWREFLHVEPHHMLTALSIDDALLFVETWHRFRYHTEQAAGILQALAAYRGIAPQLPRGRPYGTAAQYMYAIDLACGGARTR